MYTEGQQIPEEVLVASHWNGHSFEDSCRWNRRTLGNLSPAEVVWRNVREADKKQRTPQAYEALSKASKGNLEVSAVVNTDQVFDGLDYPVGTIIRIHDEHLTRERKPSFREAIRQLFDPRLISGVLEYGAIPDDIWIKYWRDPIYRTGEYLAVVSESPAYPELHRRRLLMASEYALRERMHLAGYLFDERAHIVVGQVNHDKYVDDILDITGSEGLSRVSKIEILQIT